MPVRIVMLAAIIACAAAGETRAQQPKQPPAAGQSEPSKQPATDQARKQQILNSPQWRRAMFEFKEWLSAQHLYDAQQVEQIKRNFNERVAAMSASELEFMLQDMEAKFKILNSPQAEEARAWMASYLSVMSEKKRAEVLKSMPNVATMTAAEMQQELAKIEQKRAAIESEQAAFERSRQAQVNQQLARDRAAQQQYVEARNAFPTESYSPYRSGASAKKPYSDYHFGPQMGYYVSPWGGVGITINPSSW